MLSGLPRISRFALSCHEYFANQIWSRNSQAVSFTYEGQLVIPCYHSQFHIEAVMKTSEALVKEIFSSQRDPLHILADFEQWVKANDIEKSSRQFLYDHLAEVFVLSFACHDLGNLTTSAELHEMADSWQPEYATEFQLAPAVTEQRSVDVAMKLIDLFLNIRSEGVINLKKLVQHLITQTVFDPTKTQSDQPFWLCVQMIDQIGGHFFSQQVLHQASAGYLNEIYVSTQSGNRRPLDLNSFVNFLPNRLTQLLPDLEQKSILISILDPLDRKQDYLEVNVNVPVRAVNYEQDIEAIYTNTLTQ